MADAEGSRATPERIADYYFNVTLPHEAERWGRTLSFSDADKSRIRDAIIKYESIELEPEDALKYRGDHMNEDQKTYVQERIDYYKESGMAPGQIAARALQDLQMGMDAQRDPGRRMPMLPTPLEGFDRILRNQKYNEMYGEMSDRQAEELGAYRNTPAEDIQRDATVLNYLTDSPSALAKGLASYTVNRDSIITRLKGGADPAPVRTSQITDPFNSNTAAMAKAPENPAPEAAERRQVASVPSGPDGPG